MNGYAKTYPATRAFPSSRSGEAQEQEARALAGIDTDEGWPGWDVLLPWLDWKVTTQELVTLATSLGLQTEDLDEEVHDLAQAVGLGQLNTLEKEAGPEDHISAQEAFASKINNGGREAQVAFLLRQ